MGDAAVKCFESILGCIGNTPMVRLRRLEQDANVRCELYAKCEFMNPGSVKDRIALRMIEDAERDGKIKPGDTLIEPTSGNTGLGIACVAAIKGYKCIITMPEKMSMEKVNLLKLLGAQIVRTPTEAAFDSPESHISVARRLCKEMPNSFILDQYSNPANVAAHYNGTGEEILQQMDNKVDVVVAGAGTGGTITGIARKLKERLPNVHIVGVDPEGSILAQPDSLNSDIKSYKVEGIGYDFVPDVLDRSVVDEWIKSRDMESFSTARRLIQLEGMMVGGSSGSAVWAALQVAQRLDAGKRVVIVCPDSVRNYMTKMVSDDWMLCNHFLDLPNPVANEPWAKLPVSVLPLQTPVTLSPDVTCEEAIVVLNKAGVDQLPVVNAKGEVEGVLTEGQLMAQMLGKRVSPLDEVRKIMHRQFEFVTPQTELVELTRIFCKTITHW
ncbi:Cystathionine beta-synthase [Porphyridium purpureum]|uniref:Cystathionine beta-synthase n=1 Tax=Porphyridium purpureum TaxID=35688 RepID=A0A5J4YTZ0_PORPP|nr:Cystathionine beta-synthase [Porphyridium purpureum]|eukprot:POR5862..scf227_4